MSVPPPPRLGSMNLERIPAGTELHRFHHKDYAGNAFNPGLGRPTRFHPIATPDGTRIPTLYAGQTTEVSAYEYIFHDVPYDAPDRSVPARDIDPASYSVLVVERELTVVTLFEPDLNRWGTTRSELIDTPPHTYADTARWAAAIHEAETAGHGLVWTSRRADPGRAYLFFGDRLASADLRVRNTERVGGSRQWLERLNGLGKRAGIRIIV